MTSMQRVTPSLAAALVATWATASCVDTSTSTCADGARCRAGNLCVDQADGPVCVPAARIHDCMDKQDGEQCRYDDTDDPAACRAGICTLMVCGNGHVELDEVCDDGNAVDGDGCSRDCLLACGDGIVQYEQGEICDIALPLPESCLDRGFDMGTLVCDSSCMDVSVKSCTDFDWQPMPSVPDGWHFSRVWVRSPEHAWAVGVDRVDPRSLESLFCTDCGGIFEYDGVSWRPIKDDLPVLLDLWARTPDDVYAVGVRGNIWHFDGNAWTAMAVDPNYHLGAIWSTGPSNVFAVGVHWQPSPDQTTARLAILRYDGSAWAPMDLSRVPQDSWTGWRALFGVWGSGPSNVFAVGSHNTILHYDGNSEGVWTRVDREPALITLFDVWGTHAEDVVVAGDKGTILRHDGQGWSQMETPTRQALSGIWGLPGGQMFAVGAGGTLLGHDPAVGAGWRALASGTSSDLGGIHGTSADNIMAVGANGAVLRLGKTGWTNMDLQGNQAAVTHLWGTGLDCLYAVDEVGRIWHHDGNQDWRWAPQSPPGGPSRLEGVHGLGCGQHVFAVGFDDSNVNESILGYLDGEWFAMNIAEGAGRDLKSVWAASPDAVFAVGQQGTILHYDGNPERLWNPMDSGIQTMLTSVWGTSASDVFAVGSGGVILHYDGTKWTPMASGIGWTLYDVWGTGPDDVFAVGEATTILHYDGTEWKPMAAPATSDALHVVWGNGPSNVFAASSRGALLHYDGTHWSPMRSPTETRLWSIWGTAGGEHLLASDNLGRVFRLALPLPDASGN